MKLISAVFIQKGMIPQKYTCQGQDINPPLQIENFPKGTKSLALIVDDLDASTGPWRHWSVFNIPLLYVIAENSVPGMQGENDFGNTNYGGPCPPSGTHRYVFQVYALNTKLNLEEGVDKNTLQDQIEKHTLEKAELLGLYQKR